MLRDQLVRRKSEAKLNEPSIAGGVPHIDAVHRQRHFFRIIPAQQHVATKLMIASRRPSIRILISQYGFSALPVGLAEDRNFEIGSRFPTGKFEDPLV